MYKALYMGLLDWMTRGPYWMPGVGAGDAQDFLVFVGLFLLKKSRNPLARPPR